MFALLKFVFPVFLGILLECSSAISENNHCVLNITNEFHENQPLLLRQNVSEFLYPRIQSPSIFETNNGKADIRVACPNDVLINDREHLQVGTAFLKCYGSLNYGIAGSQTPTPFDQITCAKPSVPLSRIKRNNCPIGKCMQIGFQMNIFTFLPIIDIIAYDVENKVPLWAHTKIVPVIENRQRSKEDHDFKMGLLLQNTSMEVSDIFNKEYQRKRMRVIFDDPESVDWRINDMLAADDGRYFVEGQLISKHDLFYRSQQKGTYFYENTVPMWKSVRDGNWLYVSDIVRRLATETMSELDVWSGCLGVLTLQSTMGDGIQRKIYLARDASGKSVLPVPKILFKYVYDRKANRGLIFLVVNNPHMEKIGSEHVICRRQLICETMYPKFSQVERGYTYCCTFDGFLGTAKSIGLPTFSTASSI